MTIRWLIIVSFSLPSNQTLKNSPTKTKVRKCSVKPEIPTKIFLPSCKYLSIIHSSKQLLKGRVGILDSQYSQFSHRFTVTRILEKEWFQIGNRRLIWPRVLQSSSESLLSVCSPKIWEIRSEWSTWNLKKGGEYVCQASWYYWLLPKVCSTQNLSCAMRVL